MSYSSRNIWTPQNEREPHPPVRPQERSSWSPGSPSRFVLVIDDSLTVRTILELCHQRAGFPVRSFADGVQALRWLAENPGVLPSLIYLDIAMPHLDGYEVTRILRGRPAFFAVPIVLLSNRDTVLDRLKGRLVGVQGYLTKPFRTQEVLAETCSRLRPVQSLSTPTAHNDSYFHER